MSCIEIEKKVQSFVVGIEYMHNLETYMEFWPSCRHMTDEGYAPDKDFHSLLLGSR